MHACRSTLEDPTGSRNFVDLNTIPDDIVERVEILRDGASSSYGADAIAGVVNIITKREFQGVQARAEAGISSRGDAAQKRLSLTAGIGDLEDKGFNAYMSGFYYKSDILYNRQRGYPFNTDDLTQVCADDFGEICGPNNIINGLQPGGVFAGFGQATPFAVRPRTPNGTPNGAAVGTGRYTYLNGCGEFNSITLTPAQLAAPTGAVAPADGVVCQEDITNLYGVISPDIERFGASARGTFMLSDITEMYGEVNFVQTGTYYDFLPATIRANANTGIYFPRFSTSAGGGANAPGSAPLALPVYVCPGNFGVVGQANGVTTGCTAATPGAILNPYNPYAGAGQVAQILGRLPNIREENSTRNRIFRGALGLKGTVFGGWGYNLDATASHVDLKRTQAGYVHIQNFLNAVARGEFNFFDPAATDERTMELISPDNINHATSDLYQLQGVVTKDLMELSGGPLQLGLGASWRYEAVDSPSGNSDINGPTQRFFRLNAFGTSGSRNVYSAFGELNAPILDQVEVNLSGRYDKYSSGQSAFSPKAGIKVTPIKELALRGTWSKGFRIPAFGEANALPTTGFVSATRSIYTDAYLAQWAGTNPGCGASTAAAYALCPAYITGATYGLTTLASPNLDPEKSRSFTLGAIFEPIRNWAFTVDYYDIKKTGAITNPDNSVAIAAYYSGQPIPAGFTVVPDAPDVNNPGATPRIAFVQSALINANVVRSKGIDVALAGQSRVFGVKWTTGLEASYIIELSTETEDHIEQYAGTSGNYNLTAGSGTPRWKGSWQNTFDFGRLALTGVANYFGGYDLSAEDQTGPDTAGECGMSSGYTPCRVDDYLTFDMTAQFRLNDQFTLTGTMLNVFDEMPPLEHVTYGAHLYNPVQGGTGIFGRYFRAGVKVNF